MKAVVNEPVVTPIPAAIEAKDMGEAKDAKETEQTEEVSPALRRSQDNSAMTQDKAAVVPPSSGPGALCSTPISALAACCGCRAAGVPPAPRVGKIRLQPIPAVIPIIRAPDDPGVEDEICRNEFDDEMKPRSAQEGGWRGFLSRLVS